MDRLWNSHCRERGVAAGDGGRAAYAAAVIGDGGDGVAAVHDAGDVVFALAALVAGHGDLGYLRAYLHQSAVGLLGVDGDGDGDGGALALAEAGYLAGDHLAGAHGDVGGLVVSAGGGGEAVLGGIDGYFGDAGGAAALALDDVGAAGQIFKDVAAAGGGFQRGAAAENRGISGGLIDDGHGVARQRAAGGDAHAVFR